MRPTEQIAEATEGAPEALQSAYYVYDGDSNLVKSVINGKSTYYLGKLYKKQIDGEEETIQKYYSSGSAQIAVRTIQGESDTLQWLLSDHLGSTSTTANADGTCPTAALEGASLRCAEFARSSTAPLERFAPAVV